MPHPLSPMINLVLSGALLLRRQPGQLGPAATKGWTIRPTCGYLIGCDKGYLITLGSSPITAVGVGAGEWANGVGGGVGFFR